MLEEMIKGPHPQYRFSDLRWFNEDCLTYAYQATKVFIIFGHLPR